VGLADDIKRNYKKTTGMDIMDSTSTEIVQLLNRLLFVEKKPKEEAKFVYNVLTKNGGDTERKGLHASALISSDADFCMREQVLSLLYKQSQGHDIPVGLKRIFEEGNAIHEKWQRLMIRGGWGSYEDMDRTRMNKKYEISYTPDCDVQVPLASGPVHMIGEIKSVNTYQFKSMTSHPSAKKQLNWYMHLTGVHKGFVLCDDKNNQDIKVFYYEYDPHIVAPFIERAEQIQFYKDRLVNEGKLVKRCDTCTSYTCKRAEKCNMKDVCYGKSKQKL
jgi:hypothetical protein